jgi:hypothetical protein
MPSSLDTLSIIQLGRETVKGTPVAQTTRWVGAGTVQPESPKFWARTQNGLMVPRSQRGTIATQLARIHLESDLTYEQILHVLNMGFAPLLTGTGGGADKTWQFTPTISADPALNTFTIGYRKTDGTTNWDERVAYVFAESFEISAAIGENAKIAAEFVGRPIELATAITPAIAVPTVNYVPASLFKLWINDSFGTIGTTQKTGTLVSFRFAYTAPYQPKLYLDGRTDLSFSSYGLKDADFTLELQTEFTAEMATEQAIADNNPGTLRYIRLEAVGPVLGGSFYEIEIDMACEYEEGGFNVSGNRDGNGTCTLKLVGSYDVTNSLFAKIKSVNALAALP